MKSILGIFVVSMLIIVILFSVTNTDTMKAHLKQMMDVSRVGVKFFLVLDKSILFLAGLNFFFLNTVIDGNMILQYVQVKATLSVIEDERNSFLAKLLDEQNIRQKLEGKCITPQVHLEH